MRPEDVKNNGMICEGLRYAESRQYKDYTKTAERMYSKLHGKRPNEMFISAFGHVLENFRQFKQTLRESVSTSSMPMLRDYGFELITAIMPGLIANDLFTVQPAKFKNFSVFYQDFLYNTAKNQQIANTPNIPALTNLNIDPNYALDKETNKIAALGTGSSAVVTISAGALFVPITPSSVSLTTINVSNAAMVAVDNGSNGFTGDINVGGTNTIAYDTGAFTVTFNANIKNNVPVYLTYSFTGEGSNANAAELGMTIREIQGSARERRLRYNSTIESQFSYRQQWGRSMDADMLAAGMAEIRREIDEELTLFAKTTAESGASAGTCTWNRKPDSGVQYFFWREQFIDTLRAAGNSITKATGFNTGNNLKVIGGLTTKQICEIIGPRFKASGITADSRGACHVGTLDGAIQVYYEPVYGDDEFVVLHKSENPLVVGISYNPWMPLYASDPHMLADGKLHRYLITSSGRTLINAKFYVKGTLTNA